MGTEIDFYRNDDCKKGFRELFEYLNNKAANIVTEDDEAELKEALTNILPFCRYAKKPPNSKTLDTEVASPSLNFLKDMVTLAVTGKIRKREY